MTTRRVVRVPSWWVTRSGDGRYVSPLPKVGKASGYQTRVDVERRQVARRAETHLVQHAAAVDGPRQPPPTRVDPDHLLVAHRPILVQVP